MALFVTGDFIERVCVAQDSAGAQAGAENDELSDEEKKQKRIQERYRSILEKSPKRGTAFDRVYGYHVEMGKLDVLIKTYVDLKEKNPTEAAPSFILGMIESNRGQDVKAVPHFEKAEELDSANFLIPFYLGQSLVLLGENEKATEAFERALKLKPDQSHLLDIYQALGKVYQRQQETEEASKIWKRLDQEFPNNLRVQEQIALIMVEEGELAEAQKRYAQLADKATDDYRKVIYGMKSAELQIKLGRKEKALAEFEKLMTNLNPSSWLYRDVRNSIENVFRKNDDLPGLTSYYESWLEKNERDVDSMARLSRVLAQQERDEDADKWLEKAIKLAPSNTGFRQQLITQLIQSQRTKEAVEAYADLNEVEPGNIETIRDWGLMVTLDRSLTQEERQAGAAKIWNGLLKERGDDPVIVSQIADWFREAEMTDKAIELYRKSIELAPEIPQYREYLGQYFHQLERKEEALETWKKLAEGKDKTFRHKIRLAEVLAGFDYHEEALKFMQEACEEDVEYSDRLQFSKMLVAAKKYDECLEQLEKTLELTENEEERFTVLKEQIQCYQASKKLEEQIELLTKELEEPEKQTAKKLTRLAMFHEANREKELARLTIQKAVELAGDETSVLFAASRIYEAAGDLESAIHVKQSLLKLDRKSRAEYLKQIAQLEVQRGNYEEALKRAKEMVTASPGNAESYHFYANICFEAGKEEEAFNTLRLALRQNPNDQNTLFTLATALGEHYRSQDALDLYWRAFQKAEDLDDKIFVIEQMSQLYNRSGKMEKLIERLKAKQSNRDLKRDVTFCLSHAYRSVHNLSAARAELESMIGDQSKDTQLYTKLVEIAEAENNLEQAIQYQEEVKEIAPTPANKMKLANLMVLAGKLDEVEYAMQNFLAGSQDSQEIHKLIDSFFMRKKYKAVLKLADKMLPSHPNDWELHFKRAIAYLVSGDEEKGTKALRAFLHLNVAEDELSFMGKLQMKQIKQQMARTNQRNNPYGENWIKMRRLSVALHSGNVIPQILGQLKQNRNQSRSHVHLGGGHYGARGVVSQRLFDYGTSRFAVLAWLFVKASEEEKEELKQEFLDLASTKPLKDQQMQELNYLLVTHDYESAFKKLEEYATDDQPEFQLLCLQIFPYRISTQSGRRGNYQVLGNAQPETKTLTNQELNLVLRCVEALQKSKPEWQQAHLMLPIVNQLEKQGRKEKADQIYTDLFESAKTVQQAYTALQIAAQRKDIPNYIKMMKKRDEITQKNQQQGQGYGGSEIYTFGPMAAKLAKEEDYESLSLLLEVHLDSYAGPKSPGNQQHTHSHSSANRLRAWRNQHSQHVQIYDGQNNRGVELKFPSPNAQLNHYAVQLFRNYFEFYKLNDQQELMISKVSGRLKEADEEEASFYRQLHSALLWWNGSQEEALEEYQLAFTSEEGLELESNLPLIRFYAQQDMPDEALELLAKVKTENKDDLKLVEWIKLELSLQVNDTETAKESAKVLSLMKLDFDSRMQLTNSMRTLGMQDQAGQILKKARRTVGNKDRDLNTLMESYQQQGNLEVASEIAVQLLQKTPPAGNQRNNNLEYYQRNAAQLLKRAGRLDDIIEQAEKQLADSPKATEIMKKLMIYYGATNQKDKASALSDRMLNSVPQTASSLMKLATTAMQSNDYEKASKIFLKVLEKDASVIKHETYQMGRAFERSGKREEMVAALEKVDLSANFEVHNIMNILGTMQHRSSRSEPASLELTMRLFTRIWDQYPDERLQVLGQVRNPKIWESDGFKKYLKTAYSPDRNQLSNHWAGFPGNSMSYESDGKISMLATRFFEFIKSDAEMAEYTKLLEEKTEELPHWLGGKALLGLLYAKQDQIDKARDLLESIQNQSQGYNQRRAQHAIAQVLEDIPAMQADAIKLYEKMVESPDENYSNGYRHSPAKRLVTLYKETDQKDKSLKILADVAKRGPPQNYGGTYGSYQKLNGDMEIGREMVELGFAFEAYLLFHQTLQNKSLLAQALNHHRDLDKQIEKEKENAFKKISSENLTHALSNNTLALFTRKKSRSLNPLVSLILTSELEEGESLAIANTYTSLSSGEDWDPQIDKAILAYLEAERQKNPEEVSLMMATAIIEFSSDGFEPENFDSEPILDFIQTISEEKDKNKPAKGERKLTQAEQQDFLLSAWIITRSAWEKSESQPLGDELSEAVLKVVREKKQNDLLVSMLKDRGEYYLKRGDKKAAEADWSELLELLLTQASLQNQNNKDDRGNSRTTSRGTASSRVQVSGTSLVQGIVSSIAKAASDAKAKNAKEKPITLERFRKIMALAKLAAENEMPELSRRAVVESLKTGPPRPEAITSQSQQRIRARQNNQISLQQEAIDVVEESVTNLIKVWKKNGFSAEEIYDVLVGLVFPGERPDEIFSYTHSVLPNREESESRMWPDFRITVELHELPENPQSLASVLVVQALNAGRVEDLRTRLNAVRENQSKQLTTLMLLLEIDLRQQEYDSASKTLKEINTYADRASFQPKMEMVCQLIASVQDVPEISKTVYETYQVSARNLLKGTQREPTSRVLLKLASTYVEQGKSEEARQVMNQSITYFKKISRSSSNDRDSFLLRQQLVRVAEYAIQSSDIDATLEYLSEHNDLRETVYDRVPLGNVIAPLNQQLNLLTAEERFEKLLDFVLPTEGKTGVRLIKDTVSIVPTDSAPGLFYGVEEDGEVEPATGVSLSPKNYGVFSASQMLIDTSRELRRLPEVKNRFMKVKARQSDAAMRFQILLEAASGHAKEVLPQYLEVKERIRTRIPPTRGQYKPYHADYFMGLAMLEYPELREHAKSIVELVDLHAFRSSDRSTMTHAKYILNEINETDLNTASGSVVEMLPYWDATSYVDARTELKGTVPSIWIAQNEQISHIAGPNLDCLYFAYPLQGNFEFTFETLNDRWSEGHGGYAGLIYQLEGRYQAGEIWGAGLHGRATFQAPFMKHQQFNEIKIQVSPEGVSYYMNGELFAENKSPSQANPWITMFSEGACRSFFRNLKFSGEVTVPEQIELIDERGLTGWVGNYFNEKVDEIVTEIPGSSGVQKDNRKNVWLNDQGVLTGKRMTEQAQKVAQQSYLYYHRPLRDQDEISYEFYYNGKDQQVAASVGSVAFFLEPDQVRLHWITDGKQHNWTGLENDNSVVLPKTDGDAEQLPLKLNDWNSVKVLFGNGAVTLMLNGVQVGQYTDLKPGAKHFGFFHFKDRSEARVRNVVLRGDWPQSLSAEDVQRMIAPAIDLEAEQQASGESTRILKSLIPEDIIAAHTFDVLVKGRALEPEQQYQYLRQWVMPDETHDIFRLYPVGRYPLHDTPEIGNRSAHKLDILEAPVLDLIQVANERGKLNELIAQAQALSLKTPEQQITKTAFLILAKLEQNDYATVRELTTQFVAQLEKEKASKMVWLRWPEIIVGKALAEKFDLQKSAEAVSSVIGKRDAPQTPNDFPELRNPMAWKHGRSVIKQKLAELK